MSRKRSRRSESDGTGAGSYLLRYGSMLLLAVVVVLVVLTMSSCTVKKPAAPQWDTQFTVPMLNRTYAMPELIRKMNQTGVGFDADSNVTFSVSRELDTVFLNADNLSTGSLTYSISKQLGKITVASPSPQTATVNLSQIVSPPGGYPATLSGFSFSVPANLPSLGTFSSAAIDTGRVWIVVSNNLGLALDTVKLTVTDARLSSVLSNGSIAGGLVNGATDSILVNLNGKTVSDSLSITAACHTPGGTINSGTGKSLVVASHFQGNLVVSAATAEVPSTTRNVSSSVDLQESDVITDAVITGGNLQLDIANSTPLTATLQITIPDLLTAGVPFTISRQIAAGGSTTVTQTLAGYHLQPADLNVPQSIPVNVLVTIPSTSPNKVTVSESQSFSVTATISALTFGSVTGNFSSTAATFDPITRDIDVPKGFDSAQIVSAVLTLEIENGVSLPGNLNLNLVGNNAKNLNVSGAVAARALATAATTELTNNSVADFFSPMPSQVTISGTASFGNGSSGTIRAGDYITGRVRIEAPVEVILAQTTVATDVSSDSISQDNITDITDHVRSARFVYNVTNHLPLGATVNILISSDSATLYTNPELRFDSISVAAAPTLNAIVDDTLSTGTQTIAIDSVDVQILKHPVLYVGNELILHGTNGLPVRLTKSDFVKIQGRIEVEYHFDGNL
jgi:hypothetical protein